MTQPDVNALALASNPATDPATLQQLAADRPELRPAIAANPATYDALLDWLAGLGDPTVDAALASRYQAPSAPTPDAGGPATPFAPSTQTPPFSGPSAASAAAAGTLAGGATQLMTPLSQPIGSPLASLPASTSATKTDSSRTILMVAGAIALVAVIALVVFFVLSGRSKAEDAQAAHEAQASAAAAAPATQAPAQDAAVPTTQPTPEPSPTPEIKAPAPANAVVMDTFAAPSGNIVCHLGEDTVACTISTYYFQPVDGSCSTGDPFTATVTAGGSVSGNCNTAFSTAGAPTLPYGSAARNDTFACTTNESGIECWSQVTGDGVFLAREGADPITR